MGKSTSLSVAARKRARAANAAKRAELEEREKSFEKVFAGIFARKELDEKIARGLHHLRELGVSKSEIAHDTGLSPTEVTRLLKIEKRGDGAPALADDSSSSEVTAPPEEVTDSQSGGDDNGHNEG